MSDTAAVNQEPLQSESAANDAPVSERRARASMSATLWGVDWASHLPMQLGEGVSVHFSSFDECVPFVRKHYARIFHEADSSPFAHTHSEPTKERYYRVAGDFFAFRLGDETIGLLVGTPVDWSTYYLRSAAILPEHLGKGIIPGFLPPMLDILRDAGLERVEADTSPSNLAVMSILTRLNFNVTGTVLSDRWGAHVHLTRFLAKDREEVFLRQFCSGIRFQQQDRTGQQAKRKSERSAP